MQALSGKGAQVSRSGTAHGAQVAACRLIANGCLRRHVETTLSLCCWRFLLMLTTHMPEACLLMGKAYLGPSFAVPSAKHDDELQLTSYAGCDRQCDSSR